jgi:acyl-CoA synthetase (AMP-forming)/AMP-acid ligase II
VNLFDIYDERANESGSAPALSYASGPHAGTVLSWGDLMTRAGKIAGVLRERGAVAGSRFAVVMADHPDILPALLAVWSCDAVTVVLDPLWGDTARGSVLRHSGAEFLLTVDGGVAVHDLRGTPDYRADAPPLPVGVAALAYTSGSTGAPKGIAMYHDRVLSGMLAAAAVLESYRGGPPQRVGCSMRLSGFGVLVLQYLWSAALGAQVVVLPQLNMTSGGGYWATVEKHGVDLAVLVSPLFELLLRTSKIRAGATPPLFINASGPITEAAHARFREQFGAWILNCYGLTEASFAVAIGDTSTPGHTTRSIGRPFNTRLRLGRPDGTVVSGVGEGEVQIYGPMVSDGYYDNPEANATLMAGRWLRTGDLARRGEDGKYWIVGRLKDAVMKGGQTIYLTEVEETCLSLPAVLEACAVRLDLGGGNEDIGLLVRSMPDASLDEVTLSRELTDRLGRERSPRRVVIVSEPLPRLGQDKLDRRAARARWDEITSRPLSNATPQR